MPRQAALRRENRANDEARFMPKVRLNDENRGPPRGLLQASRCPVDVLSLSFEASLGEGQFSPIARCGGDGAMTHKILTGELLIESMNGLTYVQWMRSMVERREVGLWHRLPGWCPEHATVRREQLGSKPRVWACPRCLVAAEGFQLGCRRVWKQSHEDLDGHSF